MRTVMELPADYAPIDEIDLQKNKKLLLLVLLVNILTNPAAVLLHWLGVPQIPVEIAVVLMEALIYIWFSKDESWTVPHPVGFAVVANSFSWGVGMLIQWIGNIKMLIK